jgi:hypothetical protein
LKSRRGANPLRQEFPIRDRYAVSGHIVGDVCFACCCRVVEFSGDARMTFAWCECEFPDDAAEMEIL